MKIPEGIKRCVAFIGLKTHTGEFRMCGTVFLIVNKENGIKQYVVTAKHVIEGIKSTGLDEAYVRFNLISGGSKWFSTKIKDWTYHADNNVDIATHNLPYIKDIDHIVFPMSEVMTQKIIDDNEIDVGDEVFITGLFRHHHGIQKNIPIVRIGNIAAIPEEKIQTKNNLMDAYLIEARSIGGLSGSPVFVNLGTTRWINGQLRHRGAGFMYFMMGLIHGHYDSTASSIDFLSEDIDQNNIERVNTGIAIVTPINKLIEHFFNIS